LTLTGTWTASNPVNVYRILFLNDFSTPLNLQMDFPITDDPTDPRTLHNSWTRLPFSDKGMTTWRTGVFGGDTVLMWRR
jgi:hypothetical protein